MKFDLSNKAKRNLYGTMAVIGAIAIVTLIIIEESGDIEINNWYYYSAFCTLFCGSMFYFKFRKR